jgi:hypothetical protein
MIPIMLFAKPLLLRRKYMRFQKALIRTPNNNDNIYDDTVAILPEDSTVIGFI